MKIDYSRFAFLKDIENGTLDNLKLASTNDMQGYLYCYKKLKEVWADAAPKICKNICLPCKTYLKAIEMSIPSFDKLLMQELIEGKDLKDRPWVDTMTPEPLTDDEKSSDVRYGELLGESYGCYFLGEILMVYALHTEGDYKDLYNFTLLVYRDRMAGCYVQHGEDYSYMVTQYEPLAKAFLDCFGNTARDGKVFLAHMGHQRDMFIMFERYAKIENRIAMPKTRFRYEPKAMTMDSNETRLKVHLRDSTYFTNIIRKGDFMVREHLRLANIKENGEWTKRLIYINSYVKHQYVRRAKISNND